MAKSCSCGVCPGCKASKNPNMKRKQTLAVRNKHTKTKAKGGK
jgi:hypothetical protein